MRMWPPGTQGACGKVAALSHQLTGQGRKSRPITARGGGGQPARCPGPTRGPLRSVCAHPFILGVRPQDKGPDSKRGHRQGVFWGKLGPSGPDLSWAQCGWWLLSNLLVTGRPLEPMAM